MADDFFQEALAMFREEAEDGLEKCEDLLLGLAGDPTRERVAALFRAVHTLKGSARVMGFSHLERLAHALEDVVGQVRDEGRSADSQLEDLLLAATDVLRTHTVVVVAEGADPGSADIDAIVEQLHQAREAFPDGAVAAPSPAPAGDGVDDGDAVDAGWEDGAPFQPGSLAAPRSATCTQFPEAGGRVSLGIDGASDTLDCSHDPRAAVLRRMEGVIGRLSVALQQHALDADLAATTQDLEKAAEDQELFGISGALEAVRERLRDAPDAGLAREAEQSLFEAVVEAQELVADELGVGPDAICLVRHVYLLSHLERIDGDLAAFSRTLEGGATPAKLAPILERLVRATRCLGLQELAMRLFGAADEAMQLDLEAGTFEPSRVQELRGLHAVLGEAIGEFRGTGDTDELATAERLADLDAAEPAVEPVASQRQPSSQRSLVDVLQGFEAHLTEETSQRLGEALRDEEPLFVVRGDPGADAAKAGLLMEWFQRPEQESITSRTVFRDGATLFDFLFVSRGSAAAVKKAVDVIDPSGTVFWLVYPPELAAEALAPSGMPDDGAAAPETEETPAEGSGAASAPAPEVPAAREVPESVPRREPSAASSRMAAETTKTVMPGTEAMLKVPASRVEELLNLAREISLAAGGTLRHPTLAETRDAELSASAHRLDSLVQELQDAVTALALLPLKSVFQRTQRAARDAARAAGKQVEVVLVGADTEVDKSAADRLADPLLHLVRNSVDHGLETPADREAAGKPATGRVEIRAESDGSEVHITVRDDGKGLNRDRILARAIERGLVETDAELDDAAVHALIFEAGFSTAAAVTNLSGRGVGMDVVKSEVSDLGGRVVVDSTPGVGTAMRLEVPLSVAFLDSIIARIDDNLYAIPTARVRHMLRPEMVDRGRIDAENRDFLRFQDEVLTVVAMPRVHERDDDAPPEGSLVVVLENSQRRFGLAVDELLGHEQVVVKPLSGPLRGIRGARACGLLPTGDVALVLDCERLQATYH